MVERRSGLLLGSGGPRGGWVLLSRDGLLVTFHRVLQAAMPPPLLLVLCPPLPRHIAGVGFRFRFKPGTGPCSGRIRGVCTFADDPLQLLLAGCLEKLPSHPFDVVDELKVPRLTAKQVAQQLFS